MTSYKRTFSIAAALLAAVCSATMVAPAALADNAADSSVVSTRSFPKANTVKKNLLQEATSTDVDGNWGSIESLDVPQTQSQAEKDAEAQAQAEAEAQAQAEAEAAAASRSSTREDLSTTTDTTTSTKVSAQSTDLVNFALQYIGTPYVSGGNTPAGWDCSGFVQWVFAQYGISLPRTSGAQATAGTAVASLAAAQPGDIIANGTHAAIYIGGGLVVNALNPAQGTQVTGLDVFTSGYSIRRVL